MDISDLEVILMEWLHIVSFDSLALSFLVCFAIRETMIFALPDDIAGPGGWLVDTGEEA